LVNIVSHQCDQNLSDLVGRLTPQAGDATYGVDGREIGDIASDASYVHGMIRHTLELAGHMQVAQHLAKVSSDGLLGQERFEAELTGLSMEFIDASVVPNYLIAEGDVLFHQRLDRTIKCRDHHLAHGEGR